MPPPQSALRSPQSSLLPLLRYHGVTPLLGARALHGTSLPWPIDAAVVADYRRAQAFELLLRHELAPLLERFHRAGISALVLKGTALAWSIYPSPALRPRADTDILVSPSDAGRAHELLAGAGYDFPLSTSGDEIFHQRAATKRLASSASHAVDLHWKISNRPGLADLFRFDDLLARSLPLPPLGDSVRRLSTIDALLHACIHRVAHHRDEERLIWLYDIHLLVRHLGDGFRLFVDAARNAGVWSACRDGIETARDLFGTPLPEDLDPADDASLRFLVDRQPLDRMLTDVRHVPGLRRKLRLLAQHAFPPADYMHAKYGSRTRLLLPLLYAHRALGGIRKLVRRKR